MKDMDYTQEQILRSLEAIKSSEKLTKELRKHYGTEFEMIEACIKENLLKSEGIELMMQLAPLCFNINGVIFSLYEKTFLSIDKNSVMCYKLENMSNEIDRDMFSRPPLENNKLIVSSIDYFELASIEEIVKVGEFLLP